MTTIVAICNGLYLLAFLFVLLCVRITRFEIKNRKSFSYIASFVLFLLMCTCGLFVLMHEPRAYGVIGASVGIILILMEFYTKNYQRNMKESMQILLLGTLIWPQFIAASLYLRANPELFNHLSKRSQRNEQDNG